MQCSAVWDFLFKCCGRASRTLAVGALVDGIRSILCSSIVELGMLKMEFCTCVYMYVPYVGADSECRHLCSS